LIAILRSTGPVISVRRSSRVGWRRRHAPVTAADRRGFGQKVRQCALPRARCCRTARRARSSARRGSEAPHQVGHEGAGLGREHLPHSARWRDRGFPARQSFGRATCGGRTVCRKHAARPPLNRAPAKELPHVAGNLLFAPQMQPTDYMREAIRLASAGRSLPDAAGPSAASIVRRGEIVGRGSNGVTSTNDPTAHAEVDRRSATPAPALADLPAARTASSTPVASRARCAWPPSTGRGSRRSFYGNGRDDAAAIGFDDAFIYEQVALPPG
jgi:hypothetical protein